MPYFGSNSNAELQAGMTPTPSTGHVNPYSHTLDGLQADSDEWDSDVERVATTPHSALAPFAFSRNASPNGADGTHFIAGYGFTGSGNAESTGTYGKEMSLRMAGDSSADLS